MRDQVQGIVEEINDINFESEVLGSEQPFLLDFSATWCAPCRALEPIVAALADEYRGRLRVGKLDIDNSPLVAARLRVRGAPTLIVFRDGKEAARRIGFATRGALAELCGIATAPIAALP